MPIKRGAVTRVIKASNFSRIPKLTSLIYLDLRSTFAIAMGSLTGFSPVPPPPAASPTASPPLLTQRPSSRRRAGGRGERPTLLSFYNVIIFTNNAYKARRRYSDYQSFKFR